MAQLKGIDRFVLNVWDNENSVTFVQSKSDSDFGQRDPRPVEVMIFNFLFEERIGKRANLVERLARRNVFRCRIRGSAAGPTLHADR